MPSTIKLLGLSVLVIIVNYFSIDILMEGLFVSGSSVGDVAVYLSGAIILLSLGGFIAFSVRRLLRPRGSGGEPSGVATS